MDNYHSKLKQRYTAKLRVLEGQLPYYCTQYFNAKSHVLEKQSAFAYAVDFKVFFEFLKLHFPEYEEMAIKDIPLSAFESISSHDMNAYIAFLEDYELDGDHRHNGENGIQRKLSSVKSLCRYLFKEEMIAKNPAELVEMPKQHKKDILILKDSEISRLFYVIENEIGMTQFQAEYNKKCINRDYAIMMMFLGTGMRISELVGLDLRDIDFTENLAHIIRKGGNEQYVFFSQQVADALRQYLGLGIYTGSKGTRAAFGVEEDEQALFVSIQKRRLSVRAVQKLVAKYSNLAFDSVNSDRKNINQKNKLHAHLFRKTYGTNLYLDTKDIKLVQDTLGHNSITTTEKHYVKDSKEHRKLAARDVLQNPNIKG